MSLITIFKGIDREGRVSPSGIWRGGERGKGGYSTQLRGAGRGVVECEGGSFIVEIDWVVEVPGGEPGEQTDSSFRRLINYLVHRVILL